MQEMLKLSSKRILLLLLVLFSVGLVAEFTWAEEPAITTRFTFREYYRWEGDAQESLRHVPIKEWSPYDLHPDFLDITIRVENQSKTPMRNFKAVIRIIPMVGDLLENKQFGFDIDRLNKTAVWAEPHLTTEFLIEDLSPGKALIKRLNDFDLKRLLDTLFEARKWPTRLKVETTLVSTDTPTLKVMGSEVLKIVPPSE